MKPEAKYLTLHFEGYFMCRIATDPDPTDEPRGTSGYTMALVDEAPLDQVIRLQPCGDATRLREPADSLGIAIGVRVRGVDYDGRPDPARSAVLAGATVNLLGRDDTFDGPTFVSRNNTVGSDDTMAFVVEPFELAIRHRLGDQAVEIHAEDYLEPAHPERYSWEIDQPKVYDRRLPTQFLQGSDEAHQAIGVYDEFGYFRDRRRWLGERIAELDRELAGAVGAHRERLLVRKQGYKSRVFQIESWGDRVSNKLGFLCRWDFLINGPQRIPEGRDALQRALGGHIDCDGQRWPVSFWFGGWDGDLLTGYLRGTLQLPFTET